MDSDSDPCVCTSNGTDDELNVGLNGLTVECALNGDGPVDYVFRDQLVDLNGTVDFTPNGFFVEEDDDVSGVCVCVCVSGVCVHVCVCVCVCVCACMHVCSVHECLFIGS